VKPQTYEWGHPQFDRENYDAWQAFVAENPYVENR